MTETTDVLRVAGYQAQSAANVALVNENKVLEERLLRHLDALKALPSPRVDQRWLSIARTSIEQGFMAANRAIFQPKRVDLPGDDAVER